MKRSILFFTAILAMVGQGYAQFIYSGDGTDIVVLAHTNLNGVIGQPVGGFSGTAAIVQQVDTLHLDDVTVNGVQKGPSLGEAFGSFGLISFSARETLIDGQSVVLGGSGSNVTATITSLNSFNAYGGIGVAMQGQTISNRLLVSNATVGGGSGGSVNNDFSSAGIFNVNGGVGVGAANGNIELQNGAVISGGNGGAINTTAAIGAGSSADGGAGMLVQQDIAIIASDDVVVEGGDGGSINGLDSFSAIGGDGVSISGSSDFSISGGTYLGGVGGTINGADNSVAVGGNGILIRNVTDATISGGIFTGGTGGSVNGKKDADGNAVQIIDSTVTVSGGTFNGDFLLSGTGSSTVSLESSLVDFTTPIRQTGGTVTFDEWEDAHFNNTLISSGTMHFTDKSFTHEDGDSLVLGSMDSAVNFNGGLLAKAGSQIEIAYDGTDSTAIEGSDLIFEEGAWVTVNGGASAIEVGDEITLAVATNTLTASTNTLYVKYEGTGAASSWAVGFTSLAVEGGKTWKGTYGYGRLEDTLGLDPDSDFATAMSDFSDYVLANGWNTEDGYDDLKNLSEEEATLALAEGYVRAPEVANTMIQMQGIFADQIKGRTRSYLRNGQWGLASEQGPSGAQGPAAWDNAMEWLNDRLPKPKWDSSMDSLNNSLPEVNLRKLSEHRNPPKKAEAHPVRAKRIKVEIPESYQVWGGAYGTRIEQGQTSNFGGYNASIYGGIIGVDKRFSNLLLGLGGGFAQSTVDGGWGSDAETDSGYGTAYAAVAGEKLYFDINATYAFHSVETEGDQTLGYTGDYDANSASIYIGGGLGFDWGKVLFAPEVSLLSTYYDREAYTETSSSTISSYPDKHWEDYSEWSYLGSMGATLSTVGQIDSFNLEMEFQPELRVHWLHEFNADMDNPIYSMTPGSDLAVTLQAREEDLVKVGAGVRFSKWDSDTLELGLDIDGAFGSDYEAYIVSGRLLHRF